MAETIKTLSQRISLLEQEIAEIKALVKEQIAKPAPAKVAASVPQPKPEAIAAPKPAPVQEESVSPEVMAVIAAAVTHFLGLRARIRSARMIQQPTGVNPWAQQGRVFVQASHNLHR